MKIPYRWLRFPLRATFGLVVDGTTRWIEISTANWGIECVLTWPQGTVEQPLMAVVDLFLPKDGITFDIGANWGYVTLYAASRSGFVGHIHSFEPYPPTAADLKAVVAQSGFGSSVTIHEQALSDRDGIATMVVPDRNRTALATIAEGANGESVTRCRLDALDLPSPDLIKLDVEGHELEVLKGSVATVEKSKPVIVFENQLLPQEVVKSMAVVRFLETLGYHIFAPALENLDSDGYARLVFTEVTAETRADFPDLKDMCAIHRDRMAAWTSNAMG